MKEKLFFDESKEIFSFINLNNKERAGGFRIKLNQKSYIKLWNKKRSMKTFTFR